MDLYHLQPIQDLCKSLQQEIERRNSSGNEASKKTRPLRNKSMPKVPTSKPTNRRHVSRKLSATSSPVLQDEGNFLDTSSGSLNASGLSSEATNSVKPGSSSNMHSSLGSLDLSDSTPKVDPTHSVQPMNPSPRRWKRSDQGLSAIVARRSTSRTSSLKREMNETMMLKGNLSLTSLGDDDSDLKTGVQNPLMIISPTKRIRKRRTPSKQLNTNTASNEPNSLTREIVKIASDEPSVLQLKHRELENRKESTKRVVGGSMRNLLRNKCRLERKLHNSEVFHFVLHKSRLSTSVTDCASSSNKVRSAKQQKKDGQSSQSKETMHRTPLDKFLLMKQRSERIVLENEMKSRQETAIEGSATSLKSRDSLSSSASTSRMHSVRKTEMTDMDREDESDDGDSKDDPTVVSLDIYETSDDDQSEDSSVNSLNVTEDERLESHTLSLNLDDIQREEDEQSDQCSERTLQAVKDILLVDSRGRKGTYSGLISHSSGMPCGKGRLEYPDKCEIFEGDFVHGYWTGYGRCIYTRSGEDYFGTFLDNIRHGHGSTTYQDGRVFEGTYFNGIKIEGKMTYQDGSTYLGRWSDDVRHGRGTYTFADGSFFLGEFEDDRMHGSGILAWSDGSRYVGTWKHGLRDGPGQEFRPNGTVRRQGMWKDGAFVR